MSVPPAVLSNKVADHGTQRYLDSLRLTLTALIKELLPVLDRSGWEPLDMSKGTWRRYTTSGWHSPEFRLFPFQIVRLRGAVEQASAGNTIGILPSNCRPTKTMTFSVRGNSGNGEVQVKNTGEVAYVSGGTTFLSLDHISFEAS